MKIVTDLANIELKPNLTPKEKVQIILDLMKELNVRLFPYEILDDVYEFSGYGVDLICEDYRQEY